MRRLSVLILVLLVGAIPAAAQDRVAVPDVLRYADYVPATAVAYAAVRADVGYREQTDALLARLEPLIGEASYTGELEGVFGSTLDITTFLGDAIVIAVLSPDTDFNDLFGDDAEVAIIFGVRDRAAARAFIEGSMEERPTERNGWLDYAVGATARVLLRDDVMIVTPVAAYADQVISGDYGALSRSADFGAARARLPQDRYDLFVYFDPRPIVADMSTRGTDANAAVSGLLGTWMLGGVSVGGRDLLLDIGWNYGDLSDAAAYGFTPDMLIAPPVDTSFAAHVPASTQFYLQSANFGGMIRQSVELLNVLGGLMEHDASTTYFGLEGLLNAHTGDTLQAVLSAALSSLSGLDLQTDVIEALKGEFALHFSVLPVGGALRHLLAFGLVLDESGQGQRFVSALVDALDRAGQPIKRIDSREGVSGLDLSAFTDPFFVDVTGLSAAADEPALDVWFATGSGLMALGTAPGVRFALDASLDTSGDTLADSAAYRHAVESVFLPDAQGIAFVNGAAFAGLDGLPDGFLALIESASASMTADAAGVTGRLALSLR